MLDINLTNASSVSPQIPASSSLGGDMTWSVQLTVNARGYRSVSSKTEDKHTEALQVECAYNSSGCNGTKSKIIIRTHKRSVSSDSSLTKEQKKPVNISNILKYRTKYNNSITSGRDTKKYVHDSVNKTEMVSNIGHDFSDVKQRLTKLLERVSVKNNSELRTSKSINNEFSGRKHRSVYHNKFYTSSVNTSEDIVESLLQRRWKRSEINMSGEGLAEKLQDVSSGTEYEEYCQAPEYIVYTWVLCLVALATALKLYYLVKTILAIVMVSVFTTLILVAYQDIFDTKYVSK